MRKGLELDMDHLNLLWHDMAYPQSQQHLQVQLFSITGTLTWECGTTMAFSLLINLDTIESTSSLIVTRVKPIQNLSAFIS